MAADVGDYSREAPSLMVHGKGNKDRVVPLHAVAQGALDAYLATRRGLAPEHPLFVSWRGRITKQVMGLLCKRVSRRIGRRLHPHLFRYTFATELLNRRSGSARDPDAARARVAGHHRDLHAREPGARAGGGGAARRIAEWTLTTLARVPAS
jgi:integrase